MVARVDLIPGVKGLVLGQTWYRENACVWNVETGWVHTIDDITFQVKYDKYATLVSRVEAETDQPAIAWRVEAVSPEGPVAGFHETEAGPLSGIGMIRIKHSTWALNRPTGKDSDEDSLDPDYMPEESMDSQSEPDSEDEYIEEHARRARNRPVSPAKPGEGALVPVTAVKQEPMGDEDSHWTSSSDAVAVSGQPLRKEAPRWSSIMEAAESSSAGAAVEVPSWASEVPSLNAAPRWSSIRETVDSPTARVAVEGRPTSAPRLEPVDRPVEMSDQTAGWSDMIVVESADGVKEEYIIKSEINSSENEAEVPPSQPLSPGNAMAAAAVLIGDGVVDSDSLFTKDEIREAQQKDDGIRISIEFWQKGVPPDRAEIRTIPEDAKSLLLQFESLQVRDSILYRRFHHPDGTTKYWQLVLPVSLRREYIQRIHADLGHFGQTKTCEVFARRAYFPGWRPYVKLVVRNCTTCNKS